MLSLNQGKEDTGLGWYEKTFRELAERLKRDKTTLLFTIWWGHNDPMVPRKAQSEPGTSRLLPFSPPCLRVGLMTSRQSG